MPPLPPHCRSARCAGVAYSTFTIIHIIENDEAELIQYDNPLLILIRDGKFVRVSPKPAREIDGKMIYKSEIKLHGERLPVHHERRRHPRRGGKDR